MVDLKEIEARTFDLVGHTKTALRAKKYAQKRTELMTQKLAETRQRLERMLQEINEQIESAREVVEESDPVIEQLQQHQTDIQELLADAEPITAAEVDAILIDEEEKILNDADQKELQEWREQLRADIIDTILAQNGFFPATEASLMVLEHKHHLEAMGAFNQVVETLVNQINIHDGKKLERGGLPCVEIKSSATITLNYIASKAKENRPGASLETKPLLRHRVTEAPPTHRFDDLKGRVLVFGGYKALEEKVKRRLSRSNVHLTWETIQEALRETSLTSLLTTHEIVILIEGYDLKSQEQALKQRLEVVKSPLVVKSIGLELVEEIAKQLRALQLLKLGSGSGRIKSGKRY